ncbi:VanZ family protein [Romboutsia sedimentorum]|uniref:VanZ family protein n=1 Tax=Romboutsia sedimentorum TaxID=1368474 RepID=A0ABT7E7P4_9FIRM|nr:VanZ family protein [Romboutsia sedimentorum]MDK2562944.1 VanZ family protein [Romboutsia sedimentorum]
MIIEFSNLIFFGLIFCYLATIILFNYMNDSQINYKKEFINLGLLLSVLLIISQTIFPLRLGYKFEEFEIYNLIPLKVSIMMFTQYSFGYFLYQVLGNIALFVPLGFFIFIKTNKNIKKSLIIIFSITLGVEIIQGFIPYRFCEIDDLWLNTLGGYIGLTISSIINKGYVKASN